MSRPRLNRCVRNLPSANFFKPRGIPLKNLEYITLKVEELEAIRLVDLKGLTQDEAANMMGISRKTLWRDLESARRKIAEALVEGKAIEIQGGNYQLANTRTFTCFSCEHEWEEPFGTGRIEICPACGSQNIERVK
jgi:predicted DNA-binding protein (UPF0251 family)